MLKLSALITPFLMASAQTSQTADGTANGISDWGQMAMTIIPFVLIALAFYFLLIRPQRKQEKEAKAMRDSIGVGDTITTIGGITGVVRQVKDAEETYILETGADKVRIAVKKWAVQSTDKKAEDGKPELKETAPSAVDEKSKQAPAEAADAAETAQAPEKPEKKKKKKGKDAIEKGAEKEE